MDRQITDEPSEPALNRRAIKEFLLIAFVAAILVGLATVAAFDIESRFLQHHSFFYDPASYQYQSIRLFQQCQEVGAWPVVCQEFLYNRRSPARTIPVLLLKPDILADLWGHMWSEIPLLYLFVLLLMWTVYRRTSSLWISLSSAVMFCSVPLFFSHLYGLACFWLDTAAACALGASILCLINYCRTARGAWLIGFGALASLTALCRWTAAFYVLAFAVVALPVAVWTTRPRPGKWTYALLVLCLLPGVIFTARFLDQSTAYYQTFGYNFKVSVLESFLWTGRVLFRFFSIPMFVVILSLLCMNFIRGLRGVDRVICFLALWFPVSLVLFLCFLVKSGFTYHPRVYLIPAFIVAAFCAFSKTSRHWMRWQVCILSVAIICLSLTIVRFASYRQEVCETTPYEKLEKQRDLALADLIAKTGARTLAEFDFETIGPELEAFYRYGILCKEIPDTFSVHEAYFKGFFGKDTPIEKMADLSFAKAKTADLIIVFSQPGDALKPEAFNNRYSSTISKIVSERAASDPDFTLISNVPGPSGMLSVYRNSKLPKVPSNTP